MNTKILLQGFFVVCLVFIVIITISSFVTEAETAAVTFNSTGQTVLGDFYSGGGLAYGFIMGAAFLLIIFALFKLIK